MNNVSMVCVIDCPSGKVTIRLTGDSDQETIELKWCRLDDNEYGFVTTHVDTPVRLTEVSAEYFIIMLFNMIIDKYNLSSTEIEIINERGDILDAVKFMPPTFTGTLIDIESFVRKQMAIQDIMAMWEKSNRKLTTDFLNVCNSSEVLDDVLSLIEVMASRLTFSLKNLNIKE